MDKPTLLKKVQTGYAELEQLISSLSEEQMTTVRVDGEWSVKDNLAHLMAWQKRMLAVLQAAVRGEAPSWPPQESADEEIDRRNAAFYEQYKSLPLADVRAEFRTSYREVLDTLQALPERDLIEQDSFTWMHEPLWQFVAGDTYEHYEEHGKTIQEWLARSGLR